MMSMMYQAYQNHMDLTAPWRTGAAAALKYLNFVPQGVSDKVFGRLAAIMSGNNQPARPATLTLMAGPIDTRPADQGQRFRQEQAAEMVRGEPPVIPWRA